MYKLLQKTIVLIAVLMSSGASYARMTPDTLHYARRQYAEGNFPEVIRLLQALTGDTAAIVADTLNIPAILLLSDAYAATGNKEGAYRYYQLYKRMADTIGYRTQSAFLDSLVTKDQLQEKEKTRLERQLALDKDRVQLQQRKIWIWIAVLLCTGVFLLVVQIWRIRRKQRQIVEKSRYQLVKEKEIAELNARLDAELTERAKIFERLQQQLSPQLDNLCSLFRKLEDSDSRISQEDIRDSMAILEDIDKEVAKIFFKTHIYYPSGGLIDNLQRLLNTLREPEDVALIYNERDHHLSPFMVHELLRVLQEFLQNTIKHTQNFSVAIRIHFTKDHVRIEMQSNTPQFAIQPAGATGLGLTSIRQRVEKLKGTLLIERQQGFIIILNIPL